MHALSEQDKELLKLAASFVNLRVRDFAELAGRSDHAVRERMPKLMIAHRTRFGENKNSTRNGLGHFYRLPDDEDPEKRRRYTGEEYTYRLTQKGWDEAHRLFPDEVPEVNANREKSENQLEHDLVLTDFH